MAEIKEKFNILGFAVDVTDVSIERADEHFDTYTLGDGTVLRVKSVATAIKRVDGQYLPDGNPIYIVQTTPTVSVQKTALKQNIAVKAHSPKAN